jgi:hypothetical protein
VAKNASCFDLNDQELLPLVFQLSYVVFLTSQLPMDPKLLPPILCHCCCCWNYMKEVEEEVELES